MSYSEAIAPNLDRCMYFLKAIATTYKNKNNYNIWYYNNTII